MPEPTLATLPRSDVAFILDHVDGLPLHVRREKLYRWSLDRGGSMALVEDLLYREAEYAEDLVAFRESAKKALAAKLEADKAWEAKCRKEKRWDDLHNCEIPFPNTDDPKERRFRHNAGSDTSRDVTWNSNTHYPPPEPPKPVPSAAVSGSMPPVNPLFGGGGG